MSCEKESVKVNLKLRRMLWKADDQFQFVQVLRISFLLQVFVILINMCGFVCEWLLYLAPRESDCWVPVVLLSAADGPGLDTDALFTCPFPLPAPVELPLVNSETVVVKLLYGKQTERRKFVFFFNCYWIENSRFVKTQNFYDAY